MKTTLKKALSFFLVIAFVLSALPLAGIMASAENEGTEVTFADGSKWLAQLGSNVAFGQNAPADYSLSAKESTLNNTDFLVVSKKGFAPGIDKYAVSVDYRGSSPIFGFKDEYTLIDRSSIYFRRTESGNSTSLIVNVNGENHTILTCTATRTSLSSIEIVEDNGSYYVSFRGNVLKGEDLDADVQDYLKLENHFSKKVLEKGMLHFFLEVNQFNYANNPRIVNIGKTIANNSLISGYEYSGDTNTPSKWSFSGDVADVKFNNTDRVYTFSAKNNANVTLGLPVAKVDGNNDNAAFSTRITRDTAPSGNDSSSIDFSNDPYFADGTYERIGTVEIGGASQVHFIHAGKTITANYNMYNGAKTTFTFSGDGTDVNHLNINVGGQQVNVDFTDNLLKTDKPIYARINKASSSATREYSITVPAFNDQAIAAKTALCEDDLSNIYTSKALADSFAASELAFDNDSQCKLSDIYKKYDEQVAADVKAIDDAINALAPVDEILYQDKEAVESALALYDNATATVKNAVTVTALIEQYRAKLKTLEDNGIFRTGDGKLYNADCNSEFISISNRSGDNAIEATLLGGANTEDSRLSLSTETKYPIVSGKYEMRFYFGNLDGSSNFGFVADKSDLADKKGGEKNNTFVLYRTETSNTNKFLISIDGIATECYIKSGTTRNRNWVIGVTKIDGNYYMTVDGNAITGEGYSDTVKEAVKLNNHFDKDFLDGNNTVYFYASANSMAGGATLRATVNVENNLIIDTQNRYGDRNNASAINEYNTYSESTLTATDEGNVYNFTVPSAGSVTIAEPINPNGFDIKAYMPTSGGNQWVKFEFSNDPAFTNNSGIVEFYIAQFSNATQVIYNSGELVSRFSGFYGNSVSRQMSFVDDGTGTYRLRLFTPGNDLTARSLDFTGLIGKPIYLKISGDNAAEPVFTITNKVNDLPYMTNQTALDSATEQFLSSEATALAADIDSKIANIYSVSTDFCFYNKEANEIADSISSLSLRQSASIKSADKFVEIRTYLVSLPDEVNAQSIAGCRKTLFGDNDDGICYDYYRDGSINLLDLIRMKRIAVDEIKK